MVRTATSPPPADVAPVPATTMDSQHFLSGVSIKIPSFWTMTPESWFTNIEGQFHIGGVTSSLTKYYHCVKSFNQEMSVQFSDICSSPPPVDPYETLKARLLRQYSLTNFQRVEAMLNLPLAADDRPSTLMNAMLALMPPGYKPDFVFTSLFLRRVSSDIRSHLLKKVDGDPRELAAEADILWQDKVVPVHNLSSSQPPEDTFALRPPQMQRSHQQRRPSSQPQPRRHSDGSHNAGNTNTFSEVCYYHRTYGNQAHRCKKPCSFSGNA